MSRFKSGYYVGSYTMNLKPRNMEAEIKFQAGKISGEGTDDSGKFTLFGDYNVAAPFGLKFVKTMLGTNETLSFEGFHSSDGGMFGNWEGAGGRGEFHLKRKEPKPEELAAKRQAEKDLIKTQLLAMGFSDLVSESALEATTSLEEAIEWCTTNNKRISDQEATMRQTGPPEDKIKQLVEMGIPRDMAIEALVVNDNNVERAIEFVFSAE